MQNLFDLGIAKVRRAGRTALWDVVFRCECFGLVRRNGALDAYALRMHDADGHEEPGRREPCPECGKDYDHFCPACNDHPPVARFSPYELHKP